MKIYKTYSHLNGEEFLLVHKKHLYQEIIDVISSVDANKYKTKISKEKNRKGELLFNPSEINKAFKDEFEKRGWKERRRNFYVSDKYEIVKIIETMDAKDQKTFLESKGEPVFLSFNQTDFIKDDVAVEVQFGKYFAVTYDLFVKHLSFYNAGIIDVGIEIIPSKKMQKEMSSGPPFYEKEVHNVLRHGRNSPAVPIVIMGIEE